MLQKLGAFLPVSMFRRLSRKQWGLVGGGILLVLAIIYAVVFFDKSVAFSYEGRTCITRTILFPGLFRATNSQGYAVELSERSGLNGRLISKSLCVTPTQAPKQGEETVSVSLFGSIFMRQRLVVRTGDLPTVDVTKLSKPLPTHVPLVLSLSKTDKVHSYFLKAGNDKVPCASIESAIRCDIAQLGLEQGAKYVLSVGRQFKDQTSSTLVEKEVTTLSPLSVVNASIKAEETVFSVPQSIELSFDKKVINAGQVTLEKVEGETRSVITQEARFSGKGLTVAFKEALPRSSKFELKLSDIVAEDGSTLYQNAYTHPFSTSGGPRVLSVNIGSYGVSSNATVVVTFDQPLSLTQDITNFARLNGGGAILGRDANKLTFKLNSLPFCADFSITLTKDIQSNYGIAGNSAWSFSSRTICHTISTIGYSVKGKAINAYTFGTGGTNILYIGATHGNELSSMYLMERWIEELEANARSIPGDKRIVVIPKINPDGVAVGSRFNANNVDLNRNFPTADWKKDVTVPGGGLVEGGGGSAPLSEPESKAIASFTQQLQPRIALTYHATGGFVTPNEAGVSSALASIYANRSGYGISPKSSAGEVFTYDTCGAYEDWLFEGPGMAAILVELGSNNYSQFERNRSAMWEMMRN